MVEVTKNYIRVPVRRLKCSKRSYRLKTISKRRGIKALFCCRKGFFRRGRCSRGVELVTAVYNRKKWTAARAKSHAKKFNRKR